MGAVRGHTRSCMSRRSSTGLMAPICGCMHAGRRIRGRAWTQLVTRASWTAPHPSSAYARRSTSDWRQRFVGPGRIVTSGSSSSACSRNSLNTCSQLGQIHAPMRACVHAGRLASSMAMAIQPMHAHEHATMCSCPAVQALPRSGHCAGLPTAWRGASAVWIAEAAADARTPDTPACRLLAAVSYGG